MLDLPLGLASGTVSLSVVSSLPPINDLKNYKKSMKIKEEKSA